MDVYQGRSVIMRNPSGVQLITRLYKVKFPPFPGPILAMIP